MVGKRLILTEEEEKEIAEQFKELEDDGVTLTDIDSQFKISPSLLRKINNKYNKKKR